MVSARLVTIYNRSRGLFLKDPFFFLIIIFFLISVSFFSYKLYRFYSVGNFRYTEGKDVLINGNLFGKKYFTKNNKTGGFTLNLVDSASDMQLTPDERYLATVVNYAKTPDNYPKHTKINFYAKCSVETFLTDDLKSFCVFSLIKKMLLKYPDMNETVEALQKTLPYPGLLQPFKDPDSTYMGMLQFCTDISKKSFCSAYYYFFNTQIYKQDKSKIPEKTFSERVNLFNNINLSISKYLVSNWSFMYSMIIDQKALIVGYNINLLELGLQTDPKYLEESFKDMQEADKSFGQNNYLIQGYERNNFAWREFMYAKYYIYKKNETEAKKHIERLNAENIDHTEVKTLLQDTHLLDSDKAKFINIVPNFKY